MALGLGAKESHGPGCQLDERFGSGIEAHQFLLVRRLGGKIGPWVGPIAGTAARTGEGTCSSACLVDPPLPVVRILGQQSPAGGADWPCGGGETLAGLGKDHWLGGGALVTRRRVHFRAICQ